MSLFATQSYAARPSAASAHRFSGFARRLAGIFAQEWQNFRAARALESLDDRALNDIGVSRALIDHVVRYGRPPA